MSRSGHLVDSSLRGAIAAFPPFALDRDTLPAMRQAVSERYATVGASIGVVTETIMVPRPGERGEIRVLSHRPADTSRPFPAILHMHGGGFVTGLPELADAQHRHLAAACGVAIFSVDYRLAPETPYPGQRDDGYVVLQWLVDQAASLGIDRDCIGVKGESAGGGLAAALTLFARDSGGPALAFQLLTFPALDDRTGSSETDHPFCGEFLWTAPSNQFGWRSLLGHAPGGEGTPVYAAPARATDLSGLPPAFIAVGALDLYLEEDLEYARRLTRAGVPVELHVYPGVVHGFGIAPSSWVESVTERDLTEGLKRILDRHRDAA